MVLELSGVALGRRSEARLDALLAAARDAGVSYDHVGSTLGAATPAGLTDQRFSREMAGSLAGASAALRGWAAHRGIRARIHPAGAPLEVGSTLLVVAPFGPFQMAVPDRIVAVVEEPDRFGFVYGTLDTHAEAGEELFLVEQVGPGQLRLSLRIHARPASRPARLGAPVVRALARGAARRYLESWAAAMTD